MEKKPDCPVTLEALKTLVDTFKKNFSTTEQREKGYELLWGWNNEHFLPVGEKASCLLAINMEIMRKPEWFSEFKSSASKYRRSK